MIDRFEILGANAVRPDAGRVIYCDGTGGRLFLVDRDLELSHWRPNRTPTRYRAGTSTEICFRFLDHPIDGNWTVAVNNHVDIDGILSVYTLIHSEHARANRDTIIEAAEIGDFWGSGELPAQRVFQGITRLFNTGRSEREIYEEAFHRIPALIEGTDVESTAIEEELLLLRLGVDAIEHDKIHRKLIGPHFAHYIIPESIAGNDDIRASYVPDFNELISDKAILWPQVRTKWDFERICLVSTERKSGWFHDLYCPGYLWADTEGLWRVPGLNYHDGMRSYDFDCPLLVAAFEKLQAIETPNHLWALGGTQLPFGRELQARFPLVGRVVDQSGNAAISKLSPDHVFEALKGIFD
jgi:hypothetical protein